MDETIYPGIVSCLGLLVYYFTLYQSGIAYTGENERSFW